MRSRGTIFNIINPFTQKWLQTGEGIITRARFRSQTLLNIKKPPTRGRKFEKSIVEYEGPNSVAFSNKQGKTLLSPFNQGIFRIYLQSHDEKTPFLEQNSWTVDFANKHQAGWQYKSTKNSVEFTCTLTTGLEASLEYKVKEGTLSCRIGPDLVLAGPSPPRACTEWLLVKKDLLYPGAVSVFGLGENTPPMNKAGKKVIMWNIAPLIYKIGSNPLYQSWPVLIFQCAEGPAFCLVFDNPGYSTFEFSPDGKSMDYAVQDRELSYYILLGPTLPEVMQQLTTLTGKLMPLPKWALGYQQSRWSYAPSSRVREIAAEFRNRDIPCDVIYLDIDYMDQYKCFTWGKGFEDHEEMLRDLHSQGFKIVTILDPGLKIEPGYAPYETGVNQGMFIRNPNGSYVIKKVWAGRSHFPDFINPTVRKWWGELVKEFVKSGVDGIWCDMNEPTVFNCRRTLPPGVNHQLTETTSFPHKRVHNLYGYLMSRATCEGLLEQTPLPYVITRSTYLGGQKYAATWTGDNTSNWEHFRSSIPMILNLGLSGQPVVGPDIGGYRGTPTPALYERWILQGALYPYSRTHTSQGTPNQEPWSFGEKVENSARKAIKLRYQLIPYLYSLLYEATQAGQPMMRPIFYHRPTTEALKPEFYETEFLLGHYLLVAPLMDLATTRTCYLPPGKWYSWWCREEREGGQTYQTIAEEDTDLPLFIHENAVIPMYPDAPSFIPDHSFDSLEIIITVANKVTGLVVEYFDREALLAYEVHALKKKAHIECEIIMKSQGVIPTGYHPPGTLYIRLNHKIQYLELFSHYHTYSISPDPVTDSWTRITIDNPAFPLKGNFLPCL